MNQYDYQGESTSYSHHCPTEHHYQSSGYQLHCPEDHCTVQRVTPHDRYLCDVCESRISFGAAVWQCGLCGWDACEQCCNVLLFSQNPANAEAAVHDVPLTSSPNPVVPPGQKIVKVIVPQGASAGTMLNVPVPGGDVLSVTVPPNVSEFYMTYEDHMPACGYVDEQATTTPQVQPTPSSHQQQVPLQQHSCHHDQTEKVHQLEEKLKKLEAEQKKLPKEEGNAMKLGKVVVGAAVQVGLKAALGAMGVNV